MGYVTQGASHKIHALPGYKTRPPPSQQRQEEEEAEEEEAREMGLFKPSLLLLWLLVAASASEVAQLVESRTLPSFPSQQHGYSKILATLGVVCKCCDGGGGECTRTSFFLSLSSVHSIVELGHDHL
ncbi:uncharacterized protein J3R85_000422 [Psidium guajava]|nr:uncharacterized protein J3R85_000422 [Psidium guajava]